MKHIITIGLFLISLSSFGQCYSKKLSDFVNRKICFFENNVFQTIIDADCTINNDTIKGTYIKNGDTIVINPGVKPTFLRLINVQKEKANSTDLCLRFVDQNEIPLSFAEIWCNSKKYYYFTNENGQIFLEDTVFNSFTFSMDRDEKQIILPLITFDNGCNKITYTISIPSDWKKEFEIERKFLLKRHKLYFINSNTGNILPEYFKKNGL